jgi:hypothetical protein
MQLSQLAATPQLVQITMDDDVIVAQYGEPLTFYTWDRQPLTTFMRLANSQTTEPADIINTVKSLILDDKGEPVITGDQVLPGTVMVRAIARIVELLGK